jgi:hypothetical protein
VVGRSRNCSEPFARLRDPGGSSHSVAQLLCGLDDRLSLCRKSYVLARISSKCRCAKRECEDDAYVSDRPTAQATWSPYCFHTLIVMRLRISRKLIRHLRAQCFARDSLKFEKRSQFFVGGDDESLSVVAVCISNEDRLSVGINRCDAAPTPTGFAEIVSDDFPELHVDRIVPLLVSTQQSQNDMNGGAMTRASVLN